MKEQVAADVAESVESAPGWVGPAAWLARRLPVGRYRFIHEVCPQPARAFWARMSEATGQPEFLCDLRDSTSREACLTGQYEPQETGVLRMLLAPGMTFVDVGANWGYHTLRAAHLVGETGRVLCLEPDPRLFQMLRRNIARNRLPQVRPLEVAAAEAPGTARLIGYDPSGGNYGISQLATAIDEAQGTFRVEARDLDGLLDEHGVETVDVLKMDIEGAEALALAGLSRRLDNGDVARLLLELHPVALAERGTTPEALVDLLLARGYQAWSLDHSREASRRVAYGRVERLDELLTPGASAALEGAWPHLLLTAPALNL